MASPTWWTSVWVDSRSWWWTGKPGMMRFMGSQRIGHDWVTELTWTEKLNQVRQRESNITKKQIQKIVATGVNVILTTRGICGMCLKCFVETGAMAIGRVFKRDLKCVAKASRTTTLSTWPIWKLWVFHNKAQVNPECTNLKWIGQWYIPWQRTRRGGGRFNQP